MWSVPMLEITVEERAELERRVRAHTTPQRVYLASRGSLTAHGRGVEEREWRKVPPCAERAPPHRRRRDRHGLRVERRATPP